MNKKLQSLIISAVILIFSVLGVATIILLNRTNTPENIHTDIGIVEGNQPDEEDYEPAEGGPDVAQPEDTPETETASPSPVIVSQPNQPARPSNTTPNKPSTPPVKVTYTATQVVSMMKIGWNLGNTLDSTGASRCSYEATTVSCETYWANPVTTKAMIDEVKKAGFNAVRVPVTYRYHVKPDGTIDTKWLDRVAEIISYVLDNGMFCVLDAHHDTGQHPDAWIHSASPNLAESKKNLVNIWQQVATRFKDYDYKLVFEGMNEPVDKYPDPTFSWTAGWQDKKNINQLNQVFIDTVRATGGKNSDRVLVVATFNNGADNQQINQLFEKPTDTVKDRLILAIHNYSFSANGVDSLMTEIRTFQNSIHALPIIINEFGSTGADRTVQERAESASYYIKKAKGIGVTCFWWDDGGSYMLFRRTDLTWRHPEIVNAIMANFK